MKRNWNKEELEQQWALSSQEHKLLKHKTKVNQLGFAVLMKFFQVAGRFPDVPGEVPRGIIRFISDQLKISVKEWRSYPLDGRATHYHRTEIRNFYGYRKASKQDLHSLFKWLVDEFLNQRPTPLRDDFS